MGLKAIIRAQVRYKSKARFEIHFATFKREHCLMALNFDFYVYDVNVMTLKDLILKSKNGYVLLIISIIQGVSK